MVACAGFVLRRETRWIVLGAQNRFFIGRFDGKTFVKESGPHGDSRGALYAAQTFSDAPEGRRIQIGWVRTTPLGTRFPGQIVSQSFTLPQELTLRETEAGLRMFINPVRETERLRASRPAATDGLMSCEGVLSEVLIEFEDVGRHELIINGIDAAFTGRSARIFTDRTFNEVYVDGGLGYFANARHGLLEDTNDQGHRFETLAELQDAEARFVPARDWRPRPGTKEAAAADTLRAAAKNQLTVEEARRKKRKANK